MVQLKKRHACLRVALCVASQAVWVLPVDNGLTRLAHYS